MIYIKFISIFLFIFFSSFSYVNGETVRKGDYLEWEYFRDSQAYIDGDFMSWNREKLNNYEFKQHIIWTNEDLDTVIKKANFDNNETKAFYEAYNTNWALGETVHNGTVINISASLFDLYNTCIISDITAEKCTDFYLNAYEIAVKKFNEHSSEEYTTYNTYGPLNLPITVLVWNMFKEDRKCQAGQVIPEYTIKNRKEVKIITIDNIAKCSYSEETKKYKCILNKFYNTPYICAVSCEGVFSKQENDLVFDGYCSDQSIVRNPRPTFDIVNGYFKATGNKNYEKQKK